MKLFIGIMLALFSRFCGAADGKAPVCDAYNQAVESSLKELAALRADGEFDSNAPRVTDRILKKIAETNLLQVNVDLMRVNNCASPKGPLNDNYYRINALKCTNAKLKGSADDEACDRSKWQRGGNG